MGRQKQGWKAGLSALSACLTTVVGGRITGIHTFQSMRPAGTAVICTDNRRFGGFDFGAESRGPKVEQPIKSLQNSIFQKIQFPVFFACDS